jgi:hypothetical protein
MNAPSSAVTFPMRGRHMSMLLGIAFGLLLLSADVRALTRQEYDDHRTAERERSLALVREDTGNTLDLRTHGLTHWL